MSSFPDVKSAVDAVVEILQCGLPMARIGKYTCSWLKKQSRNELFVPALFLVSVLYSIASYLALLSNSFKQIMQL